MAKTLNNVDEIVAAIRIGLKVTEGFGEPIPSSVKLIEDGERIQFQLPVGEHVMVVAEILDKEIPKTAFRLENEDRRFGNTYSIAVQDILDKTQAAIEAKEPEAKPAEEQEETLSTSERPWIRQAQQHPYTVMLGDKEANKRGR